jgi:hypothetical protein
LKDETKMGIDMIADQILAREGRHDARQFIGPACIDSDNPRVSVRTAKHAGMQHPRQLEI